MFLAFTTFTFSFLGILALSKAANGLGLVDKPNARKSHSGHIPLVGGVSIFFSSSIAFLLILSFTTTTMALFASLTLMALTGVLDDRFDLSVRLRIMIQLIAASILVFSADIQIHRLGNPFGFGDINLFFLSGPFTILAIMTAMNAYNMVDGIDGLLGLLATISFVGLAFLACITGNTLVLFCACIMILALIPYLLFNLEVIKGRKVFMGDAGSMFIGLVIVWMMVLILNPDLVKHYGLNVELNLSSSYEVRPVVMLWVIALPLMDMLGVMVRRVVKKQNPFKPDRDHLHHIFLRAGFSSLETLLIISVSALFWLSVGLGLEYLQVSESAIFALYLFVFGVYLFCLMKAQLVVTVFRTFVTRAHS
ncbi:undecaprenyl-phosphate alpha-N-acetylglucosaminyl 1-phosphate transferase [Aliidiomarina taiwanensis]|uniref:Undecaprenyl-phosphate alpha-N-acetylglucosaminyl 1-phosphate transferase n=1 Tax=Aliidiomarina taiwanensis TaxID=946228 RepID=A0A432WTL2_9GAMM|nr:undecaprenyl-phosphate alpha-N-acetylglucosaminyl 1-phosphate transferase [Aliidiomarina taiwanensis]RUO37115.1 undecaprenyl-phosphate alpha-N-acetylglucosaminyl 1-phosphate transferase [Aliidiomarina taiwanensis]